MFQNLLIVIQNLMYFALHILSNDSFKRPLSPEDEKKYFEKAREGNIEAKNLLIEHNLRLVSHIIKKYYSSNSDVDDLISIGTIGLVKAVATYSCDKNTRFATYASKCIENEILMHFRSLKKSNQDVYISDALDTDKDGNSLTFLDVVADDANIERDIEKKLQVKKAVELVSTVLDKRETEIIKMRYGIGCKAMPQRTVAKILGISRSYVSRIESKALMVLKEHLS